jgi:hypothetical protein
LNLLIEKIGQVIQVAMVTGSLKEEKGIWWFLFSYAFQTYLIMK